MSIKRTLISSAILLFVGGLTPTWAAERGHHGHPPVEQMEHVGKVDSVDDGVIVINDTSFKLSPSVAVHAPGNKYAHRGAIKSGTIIGFKLTGETSDERGSVTEIWVLPKDYKPEPSEE